MNKTKTWKLLINTATVCQVTQGLPKWTILYHRGLEQCDIDQLQPGTSLIFPPFFVVEVLRKPKSIISGKPLFEANLRRLLLFLAFPISVDISKIENQNLNFFSV